MKPFQGMDKTHAKGQQILSSMWVFVYNMDKRRFLQKCKVRLVVCGNQQAPEDLPTRATTLAGMAFRAHMAVTTKFDLETIQMDAVNAFVILRFGRGCVYEIAARIQPREERQGPSPKEPCVTLKGGIVVFFYVDGIVFCHRKGDEEKVQEVIKGLKTEYQMSALGELKGFLEIHVLQDRSQRLLRLSQEAYVEKIAKQYEIDLTGRFPNTSMAECELLPTTFPWSICPMLKFADKALPKAADASTMLYQKKMDSMLYAATTTRSDIA
jgi:Reverse transcriptase (RNA-dependent DNA polymerase)